MHKLEVSVTPQEDRNPELTFPMHRMPVSHYVARDFHFF